MDPAMGRRGTWGRRQARWEGAELGLAPGSFGPGSLGPVSGHWPSLPNSESGFGPGRGGSHRSVGERRALDWSCRKKQLAWKER